MSYKRRGRDSEEEWIPKTRLGKLVNEGKITSIDEVFLSGLKISEPEIVNSLLPDLQEEVIDVNLVQKQTDAGEKSRFRAIVAVGNRDGYIGLGSGKASQVRTAIEKGAASARLHILPVKRGCGSWECSCGKTHSLLGLAGVKDLWVRSYGSTRTVPSYAGAVFDALRKTYSLITQEDWVK
jgi:small subunit ribosomal protein S5